MYIKCTVCNGTGKYEGNTCLDCVGHGQVFCDEYYDDEVEDTNQN